MQLTVRHLSGSRAGQQEQFPPHQRVTVGRNPSNHLRFDPNLDLQASGHHAELWLEGGQWKLRDIGSSNGTFVGGNRVTEIALRSGDIVQFGANGPRVQFDYAAAIQPTAVGPMPVEDIPVPEGRTVAMMLQSPAGAPAAAAGARAAILPKVPKKKRKLGLVAKVAITVVLLFGVLFAALAAAVLMRRSSIRKQRGAAIDSKQKVEATKLVEAQTLQSEIARTQEVIAEKQTAIAASENPALSAPAGTTTRTGTTDAAVSTAPITTGDSADLRRQLEQSQRIADELARQLQQKNDEIAAIRADKSRLAAQPRATTPPPRAEAPRQPPPASTTSRSTASPVRTPATATSTAPPPAVPIPKPLVPAIFTDLDRSKNLRRKVAIRPLPAEIAPADMPSGTPRDLGNLIGQGLIADGRFVTDSRGLILVQVSVTNYVATARTNVDVKALSNTASRLGALAGKDVGQSPVGARSVTYDAMMSARVEIIDRSGRVLEEFVVSSQSRDTKSKTSIDGIPFAQIVGNDSAPGDVARDIVGQIVERLRGPLNRLDWLEPVNSHSGSGITLAAGRNSNIEVDDVFEVLDASTVIALAKVTAVEQNAAALTIVSGTSSKLQGKMVRFAGHTGDSPSRHSSPKVRSFVAVKNAQLHAGPGFSFQKVRDLQKGARLPIEYSVGSWVRVSDGGRGYWAPLATGRVE